MLGRKRKDRDIQKRRSREIRKYWKAQAKRRRGRLRGNAAEEEEKGGITDAGKKWKAMGMLRERLGGKEGEECAGEAKEREAVREYCRRERSGRNNRCVEERGKKLEKKEREVKEEWEEAEREYCVEERRNK